MEIWKEPPGTEMVCHVMHFNQSSKSLFHWHDNFEICQPLNADCNFLVDGKLIRAQAGDLIVIDPQIIHLFMPQHNTDVRVLQFPMRILLQSGGFSGSVQTHISCEQLGPELLQSVNNLLDLMEQQPRLFTNQKDPLLQSLASCLYFLLQKHFPLSQRSISRKDSDLFFRAVTYINTHFTEESITTQQLAKQLGVCREKLAATFIQYAGMGLKLYIHTLRVNYVNQLLLEGVDISAAAYASGFGSIRTFNNAYRSVQGTTPTEFLKARAVHS